MYTSSDTTSVSSHGDEEKDHPQLSVERHPLRLALARLLLHRAAGAGPHHGVRARDVRSPLIEGFGYLIFVYLVGPIAVRRNRGME